MKRGFYRVIEKSLCTWWLQYRKLQVMFKVSPASLQTFIDTSNCALEDRVQYSTVHIPNVFCDGHLQIINCVGIVQMHWVFHRNPEKKSGGERSGDFGGQSDCLAADRQGQGDTRLTLTPSVIPNSNYVIMVKGKVRGWGLYSTTAYGWLYSRPLKEFLHSSLEALHASGVQRPQLAKEGTIDGI
jgi:hypothetical protein